MKNSNITYNVVGSTVKVVASSKLDVTLDLSKNTEHQEAKTIAELLDEQEKKEELK